MSPEPVAGLTDDAALGGRLRLLQPRRGHRFGHDAILLAAATQGRPGEHAVELGAGVGAAGLALAARCPDVRVTLVEVDAGLAAVARENAQRNAMAGRVATITLDVAASAREFAQAGLEAGGADRVLMNPPFHDTARSSASPEPGRRLAHLAPEHSLELWTGAAQRLLRAGGVLTLIYRADALADVLAALRRGFGAIDVVPVHPSPEASAIRVLLRAVKGSRAPLALSPALVLNDAAGRPDLFADRLLRGEAALSFPR